MFAGYDNALFAKCTLGVISTNLFERGGRGEKEALTFYCWRNQKGIVDEGYCCEEDIFSLVH